MDAAERRDVIWKQLQQSRSPVTASALAAALKVSRQVIVGDVALLRAQGCDIVATARGYLHAPALPTGRYVGKLACQHPQSHTGQELRTIVELGGEVLDVVVEHEVYGQLTGQLNIATMADVDAFLQRIQERETRLLSELTGGIHLHTIACKDGEQFHRIRQALEEQSLLYTGA